MPKKKDSLTTYRSKRNFEKTPEPVPGRRKKDTKSPMFCFQEHAAHRLHYDFRLEINGVLKSWAVPKGPSSDPHDKRLAVETEDHPMEYGSFEGVIPEGNYGAGKVLLWDIGTYENLKETSMEESYKQGTIEITLSGKKVKGNYALIRTKLGSSDKNWLFFKMKNNPTSTKEDLTKKYPKSVKSKKTLDEIS